MVHEHCMSYRLQWVPCEVWCGHQHTLRVVEDILRANNHVESVLAQTGSGGGGGEGGGGLITCFWH